MIKRGHVSFAWVEYCLEFTAAVRAFTHGGSGRRIYGIGKY